jgi:hypothetical protein
MAVSLPSEPEHWKITRAMGTGAISSSLSASWMTGSFERCR